VIQTVLAAGAAYLLGCLVGAYYVVRLRAGHDVRATGSGNAGARNVLRSGDKASAALTLVWDILKGAFAVLLARIIAPDDDVAVALAFIFVVVGHIWPAQLRFHGGKGAATALGCMLMVDPLAAIAACAIGVVAGGIARSATVGGLTAVAAAPVVLVLTAGSWTLGAGVAIACGIVLIAHHPSIDRRRQSSPVRPAQESTS
jgi:glycerol-3-phosphate acyltransferase PlsY